MINRDELRSVLIGERNNIDFTNGIADWIDLQISAAVAAEREACTELCEGERDTRLNAASAHDKESSSYSRCMSAAIAASNCVDKIRARARGDAVKRELTDSECKDLYIAMMFRGKDVSIFEAIRAWYAEVTK